MITLAFLLGHAPRRETVPANNSGGYERMAEAIVIRGIKRKRTTITVETTNRMDA